MGYYSAFKEILTLTTASRMTLDDIMLSKINQTQKGKYCMISPICRI